MGGGAGAGGAAGWNRNGGEDDEDLGVDGAAGLQELEEQRVARELDRARRRGA